MEKVAAIIPAAGQGRRFGGEIPKQFVPIFDKSLLFWTMKAILEIDFISYLVVVLPKDDFEHYREIVESWLVDFSTLLRNRQVFTVPGGTERQESVWEGIKKLPEDTEWVVIHDGARPMASPELFRRVFRKAKAAQAAIAALSVRDTVKEAKRDHDGLFINSTLDRSILWLAQTPQIFKKELIMRAYEEALRYNFTATDDASLVERLNHPVAIVEGDPLNIKVTSREDMEWLLWHLQRKIGK
ncbi:MAG: 2-C-methyl-D-erythritol 4-phosphate cytidylyltransferase [Syntrophobacterales bacterium]|nr:2-C-methyl-D-erythritol 4-phosphate cytidylyltransferase [Syntrophobacterales bacterium]